MTEDSDQLTFGSDGELVSNDDDSDDSSDSDNTMTRDDGEELDKYETNGGFNRYELSSLLQKAVRRSDREKAMFAAWELTRSGYGWNFWDRIKVMLVEDVRLRVDEAHLPGAIYNLEQRAKDWDMDSTRGRAAAMRAASLLAEAESSRELFALDGLWDDIAEDRMEALNNDEEPEHDFPVQDDLDELDWQVRDMHTYLGKQKNRNWAHFLVSSSRTTEETDLGMDAKRKRMEIRYDDAFDDDQLDLALSTVDEDDPWTEPHVGYPTDSPN